MSKIKKLTRSSILKTEHLLQQAALDLHQAADLLEEDCDPMVHLRIGEAAKKAIKALTDMQKYLETPIIIMGAPVKMGKK